MRRLSISEVDLERQEPNQITSEEETWINMMSKMLKIYLSIIFTLFIFLIVMISMPGDNDFSYSLSDVFSLLVIGASLSFVFFVMLHINTTRMQ